MYLVPQDIQPGTYKTPGSGGSIIDCYYSRQKSLDSNDIIDNGTSSGQLAIQVKTTDAAVKFSGGCTWTKIG